MKLPRKMDASIADKSLTRRVEVLDGDGKVIKGVKAYNLDESWIEQYIFNDGKIATRQIIIREDNSVVFSPITEKVYGEFTIRLKDE